MTPAEALHILDRATAQVTATREDHRIITEALATLAALIPPPEAE